MDGLPVEIGGRSFDLLAALVEQPGQVLSKRELMKRVWPDVVVEDGSLRFHMAGLRKLLRDGEQGARYISTQVGVGYAFVAPVRRRPCADAPAQETAGPSAAPVERLPDRLARLFGRDEDVQFLMQRVCETRVFTIVGPAGVGKTTVAVELGHQLLARFKGQVCFVDLAPVRDETLVSSAIAAALGILVQADDPMAVVLGHIRQEAFLLILDNCEHLMDAVATNVERISSAAPEVRVLATSREPLRVRSEHVHWLRSLDYPDEAACLSREAMLAYPAVALFLERASAANSKLVVDREAVRLMADLSYRLDGLPLVLELVAVRAASHGLEATAAQLGERFSLGWSGRRTALQRQQTLQAALDWSYDLLTDEERLTLERLSVFHGPFSMDAALEVISDDDLNADAAAAAISELITKSLVANDRWGEPGFYRLLEITRAYAHEKLAARGPGTITAVMKRSAGLHLERIEGVWASGGSYLGRAPRFSLHISTIRSALNWAFSENGDLSIGVRLAAACAPVFLTLSLFTECRTWCGRVVAQLDDRDRDTLAELELQAALGLSLMFTRGNGAAAETALRRALEVAEALGDRWNQLRVLGRLHIFHERIGDFKTARTWADMAGQVAEAIAQPEAIAVAASVAGISNHLAGDHAEARRLLELSLTHSAPSQRSRTIHYGFDHRNRASIALARTLWLQGYPDQAKRLAAQTVQEAGSLDYPATHCIALVWALSVDFWTGDLDQAQDDLDRFARCAEVNALGPYIAATGGFRGKLAVQQGQASEALGWLQESLARLRPARYELLTTSFSLALTQGLTLTGRLGEALELVNALVNRCNENGELVAMPEVLRVNAGVALAHAGRAEAEALLRESIAWSQRQGAKGWELRSAIDLARLQLLDDRFRDAAALLRPVREAFAEGLATTDIQAADLLLKEIDAIDPPLGTGDTTADTPGKSATG